jgi:hypothetical protein
LIGIATAISFGLHRGYTGLEYGSEPMLISIIYGMGLFAGMYALGTGYISLTFASDTRQRMEKGEGLLPRPAFLVIVLYVIFFHILFGVGAHFVGP